MRTLKTLIGRAHSFGRQRLPARRLHLDQTSIPADPEAVARYFLPPGYTPRVCPTYYEDLPEAGVEYQPGVYRRAARLGALTRASTIVDVGCGRARKLAALHPRFRVIGLDIGKNIERCRAAYPFGEWIEHDLESDAPLPVDLDVLADSVVVCADVIEHLVAPDRALRALRRAMPPARALLISTPDRARIINERELGPPSNRSHSREWSRREFASLLRWCGFADGHLTYSRDQTGMIALRTLLYVRVDAASTATTEP